MQNNYSVIGLMSGTSLDGVDIAFCEFTFDKKWTFNLIRSETISYDLKWKNILSNVHKESAEKISEVNCHYGNYLGNLVTSFCIKHDLVPDFVSSHGHTIFHQPSKGFTTQIGSGAHLAATCGYPVICDFRSTDVALGGQGAPLVPIGDMHLFPEADFCLNLGGIANISFDENNTRIAYDICACNLVLNHFANLKGHDYDKDGEISASGSLDKDLLDKLNSLNYYAESFPKSLGREDVEREIIPLLSKQILSVEDILSTFCEHIAIQISKAIHSGNSKKKLLITGGGALNTFLIKRIQENCDVQVEIPEKNIVEYKEAIIFGFLGVLRIREEINCLKSVTGATKDNCGGAIYHAMKTQ